MSTKPPREASHRPEIPTGSSPSGRLVPSVHVSRPMLPRPGPRDLNYGIHEGPVRDRGDR
jgi:hypothetical protein